MISLESIDFHIFDLDDTLINTRASYGLAQEQAVLKAYPEIPADKIAPTFGDLKWLCKKFGSGNVKEYMTAYLRSNSPLFTKHESRIDEILEIYHSEFESHLKSFSFAIEYLEQLSNLNKKLAIVSNGRTESQLRKLKLTNLSAYFDKDMIFISGSFADNRKKPSPFMIQKACNQAGISANSSAYYGDRDTDMVAGNLAEVITVLYGPSILNNESLHRSAQWQLQVNNWKEALDKIS